MQDYIDFFPKLLKIGNVSQMAKMHLIKIKGRKKKQIIKMRL
jgi:hypothetical protein